MTKSFPRGYRPDLQPVRRPLSQIPYALNIKRMLRDVLINSETREKKKKLIQPFLTRGIHSLTLVDRRFRKVHC